MYKFDLMEGPWIYVARTMIRKTYGTTSTVKFGLKRNIKYKFVFVNMDPGETIRGAGFYIVE